MAFANIGRFPRKQLAKLFLFSISHAHAICRPCENRRGARNSSSCSLRYANKCRISLICGDGRLNSYVSGDYTDTLVIYHKTGSFEPGEKSRRYRRPIKGVRITKTRIINYRVSKNSFCRYFFSERENNHGINDSSFPQFLSYESHFFLTKIFILIQLLHSFGVNLYIRDYFTSCKVVIIRKYSLK